MTLSGIDISHHNWTVIQAEERRNRGWLRNQALEGFVIMKATEGVTFDDPRKNDYSRMIGELAIMTDKANIGYYHYARPENNSALDEARHFVEAIGYHVGHALLALDVEGRALSVPNIDKWCHEWLTAVEYMTDGVKPVVYVQRSALNLFDTVPACDFGLWLASWQKQKPKICAPWEFMAIWQSNGLNIDTDFFFGSPEQWHKYAVGGRS